MSLFEYNFSSTLQHTSQNYFFMLLLCWSITLLFGIFKELISVTKEAPSIVVQTPDCQSTLHNPSSEHNSSPGINKALSQIWSIETLLLLHPSRELHCLLSLLQHRKFVSTSSHSSYCLRSQNLTPWRGKYAVRRTKQSTDHRVIPKTLIFLHTVLGFQVSERFHHHQGDRRAWLMPIRQWIGIFLKNRGPWRLQECSSKATADSHPTWPQSILS